MKKKGKEKGYILIGESNVGKSSFIQQLLGESNGGKVESGGLVKKTPGFRKYIIDHVTYIDTGDYFEYQNIIHFLIQDDYTILLFYNMHSKESFDTSKLIYNKIKVLFNILNTDCNERIYFVANHVNDTKGKAVMKYLYSKCIEISTQNGDLSNYYNKLAEKNQVKKVNFCTII